MLRVAVGGIGTVVLTITSWIFLVEALSRSVDLDNSFWAISFWVVALGWTLLVAYLEKTSGYAIACALAFGVFGVVFVLAEGPNFGSVSPHSEPLTRQFVVGNLVCLPVVVFIVAKLASLTRGLIDKRDGCRQAAR